MPSRRGVFIASLDDARHRYPRAVQYLEKVGTQTAVVLSVASNGYVRASITLAWTTSSASLDEREFDGAVAAQCGQALARALAFDAERVARERTERLQRVTATLARDQQRA